MKKEVSTLRLFLTRDQPCGYLPDRLSRSVVADPAAVNVETYAKLLAIGFRRSGDFVYRPNCSGCQACRSLRIPVADFRPNRGMRRILQANLAVTFREVPAEFRRDHFLLYRRYLAHRHPRGGMDRPEPRDYVEFLLSRRVSVRCYEARAEDNLFAVAICDVLAHGLSAVYTYFAPDESRRSLGTWVILKQLEAARDAGLDWLYLGYWIAESRKMAYKARFLPHEIFSHGRWRRVTRQNRQCRTGDPDG